MDDKVYNEIKRKADIQFKEYLQLFDENINEKDYDKLFTLLFKDIIKVDLSNVNSKAKYKEIINNPSYCSYFFDVYNERLKYFQSNNSSIFLDKLKEFIQQQNKSILKKISECKENLEIIKKYYINLILSEKTSFNNTTELSFKTKSVLSSSNSTENLEIGEVFTRYIFYILGGKTTIAPTSKRVDFYNNLFNFINVDITIPNLKIDDFKDWPFQVKYFVLIIFLINTLFNQNSNYADIFNENKIKSNINELKKIEKSTNKKKNSSKKKQKGGNKKKKSKKSSGQLNKILNAPSSKKNNSTYNKKNNSSHLKKKIIESLKQVSLYKIYYTGFEVKIIDYFKNYIYTDNDQCDRDDKKRFPISSKIPTFDSKEVNLKDFYSKIPKNASGKQNVIYYNCSERATLFSSGFKYDIFQTLTIFEDTDKFKDLINISKKLKEKVILLLFSLYSMKKYLYEEYINSCSRIFDIRITENNKAEANSKIGTNNKSGVNSKVGTNNKSGSNKLLTRKNNSKNTKDKIIENKKELIILKKLNPQQKNEYIKIKHTLNILSKKIKVLEETGHNDTQNDMKKLKYEKMYHNLIIKKMKITNSI
jgi:hypothetical protein